MQHQPAKQEKDDDARRKDPFVLPRAALHHADCIAAHAQRVGDAVQPLLRALEHLALLGQVAQHGLPAGDVVVERLVGAREEVLLAEGVGLAHLVGGPHGWGCGRGAAVARVEGGLSGRRGGLGVGVFRRGLVRAAA